MSPTQSARGLHTKIAILEASLDLFYENGIINTSLDQIARKIRVSQPAIYRHFEGLYDILSECAVLSARRGREFIDLKVDGNSSAKKQLLQYVEGNLLYALRHRRNTAALMAMFYFSLNNKKLAETHKLVESTGQKRIENFLVRGNFEKSWDVKDAQKCSRLIHSLLTGEMIKALHWPKEKTQKTRIQLAQKAVISLI